jgi:pSer/pThr/pTyr-binding forkhead associated (FHA) protein
VAPGPEPRPARARNASIDSLPEGSNPSPLPVLRTIEAKIESLFEGVFGRAFRTHVQPVELARKLAKEMDDHRMVSVSRVYAPNEYAVYLSPNDREQFESYEDSLVSELQEYLAEHARRESYVLLSSPQVVMNTDEDLDVGEFGIATRMVQPEPGAEEAAPEATPGATMVYRPKATPPTQAVTPEELGVEPEVVTLTVDGAEHAIDRQSVVIGRSKDCDIRLADPNASRRHAEVRQEGTAYWLVDLDSTNGTSVNGRRQQRARLENDDRITVGSTELVFRRG